MHEFNFNLSVYDNLSNKHGNPVNNYGIINS